MSFTEEMNSERMDVFPETTYQVKKERGIQTPVIWSSCFATLATVKLSQWNDRKTHICELYFQSNGGLLDKWRGNEYGI